MKFHLNFFAVLLFSFSFFSCTKDFQDEKTEIQAAPLDCCSNVTRTMTSVGTGDGCCHVVVTVTNSNPPKSCDAIVKDAAGNILGTVTPGNFQIFNFYPCPPSDGNGQYSGGTYSIFVNGLVCKTFKVQAICAF